MSNLKVRNLPGEKLNALIDQGNQLAQALGSMGVCPHYHSPFDSDGEVTTLIEAADADGLATSKTLAKAIADYLAEHAADTSKHSAASTVANSAYASSPAEPANLTEVQNILNEAKADFNTHIANSSVHRGVTGAAKATVGTVTTTDASDQTTANALANALKAAINAHDRAGCQTIELVAS